MQGRGPEKEEEKTPAEKREVALNCESLRYLLDVAAFIAWF